MAIAYTYPFSDAANYVTSPASTIELSGGAAQLLLQDLEHLTFSEDFASDAGFTYNNSYAEFTGGLVQQIDKRPADATIYADFTSLDASWADGDPTGTPTNGASASDGKLDLAQNDARYLDYDADLNADSQQTGCIRIRIIPNYSGTPSTSKSFVLVTKANGDSTNQIIIFHNSGTGNLGFQIRDQNDAIIIYASTLGVWSPVAGTTYEIELNFNCNGAGEHRLFEDGTLFGTAQTGAGTRSADIGLLRIGSNYTGSTTSDFYVEDFIIFDTVQHTSDYTPDWSDVYNTVYLESVVELPEFSYSGGGAIQAVTSLTTVESFAPRQVWNDLYWTGSEWAASDKSFSQANIVADIVSNISTFPVSDSISVDVVFGDVNSRMSMSDLEIGYTGQYYGDQIPTIRPASFLDVQQIETFSGTQVTTDDTTVQYTIEVDSTEYYWTVDSNWITSNNSFNQTTTLANIVANISSLDVDKTAVRWVAYLQTDSGDNTPQLSNIALTYDFYAGDATPANTCIVYGYIYDPGNVPVESAEILVDFTNPSSFHTYENNIIDTEQQKTYSDSAGYWEIELVENENMLPSSSSYDFRFNTPKFNPSVELKKTIPNTVSILFKDL